VYLGDVFVVHRLLTAHVIPPNTQTCLTRTILIQKLSTSTNIFDVHTSIVSKAHVQHPFMPNAKRHQTSINPTTSFLALHLISLSLQATAAAQASYSD